MNDLVTKLGGMKRVLTVAAGMFIVLFLVWGLTQSPRHSFGLAGKAMTAPSFAVAEDGSVGRAYGGVRAEKMAYVASDVVMAPSVEIAREALMPAPRPSTPTPAGDAKIIKSADLALYVKNVNEAAQSIDNIRITLNGMQGGAYFTEYQPGIRNGDMTIWVPSDRFDEAIAKLKAVAIQVREERITATDVSAQFVDLTARIKNLRATEAQLTEIMKRSGSVADILNVSRELSLTRSEIEQLTGSLEHLKTQVAYSSVHIALTQEVTPLVVTDEWRPLTVAKNAFKGTLIELTRIADGVIIFVVRLPILLIILGFWVALLFGGWKLLRFLVGKIRPTGA